MVNGERERERERDVYTWNGITDEAQTEMHSGGGYEWCGIQWQAASVLSLSLSLSLAREILDHPPLPVPRA